MFSLDQNWGFEKRGISYYPRSAAWDSMWVHFDADTIRSDFAEISSLGCTYARIFIRHRVCGYDNSEQFHNFKQNFDTLLNIADSYNLKLNVVIFDAGKLDSIFNLTRAKAWIDSIVTPRKSDERILRWEIISEIERVCRDYGEDKVLKWYRSILPYLKRMKGVEQEATVSIGVSDSAENETNFYRFFTNLPDSCIPDVYGLVYAKYSFLFPAIYDKIKCIIGGAKKIFITEFMWDTCTKSELFQCDQYRNSFWYMHEAGVRDVCIWTLWDFIHKDLPELKEDKQHHYGLFRTDGS